MIYTGYTQTDAYFEFTGSEGKLIMPASDVILVDDESGMLAIKNTASRCTVGLVKKGSTPPTPPPFQGKWKATYSGGTTASASCDASSAITSGEITKTDLVSVELGECVMTIGFAALNNCTSLTSVTIPNSVTSIDDNAFAFSSSLTSIDIPDSVTSIGHNAFYLCTSLITVTIGSGITSINYEAFAFCSALTAITVKATTPPTLGGTSPGGYVFGNTNNCPIYVPSGSVETYKTAWDTYADRIQPIA